MAASSRGATVEEAYVPQRPQPICLRPALKELAAPASRAAVVRRTEDEEDDDYDESGDEEDHKAEDKRNRTLDRERLLARCQEELTKYDNPQEYDDEYDESGSSDDDADVNLVDRFERQKEQERERREREEAAEAERKLSETMRSMRSASARELLDTERAYCDSLVALLELFVTPLSKLLDDGSTILDKTQQKQLFGNIPTLLKISREFCMVLEGRLNNWSDEQFIGDILLSTVRCPQCPRCPRCLESHLIDPNHHRLRAVPVHEDLPVVPRAGRVLARADTAAAREQQAVPRAARHCRAPSCKQAAPVGRLPDHAHPANPSIRALGRGESISDCPLLNPTDLMHSLTD